MTEQEEKKENQKKAIDAIKWNMNISIQYYIHLGLICFIILANKDFEVLVFDNIFNIVVNITLILNLVIFLAIMFGWKIPNYKIILYSQFQLSLEIEEKKKEMEKAKQAAENAECKYVRLKNSLEENQNHGILFNNSGSISREFFLSLYCKLTGNNYI